MQANGVTCKSGHACAQMLTTHMFNCSHCASALGAGQAHMQGGDLYTTVAFLAPTT